MTDYSIQQMPEDERPRERLLRHGPEALAAAELIAIVLGSGTKGKSVLALAQELLVHFGGLRGVAEATVQELCQLKGLGMAKALQLKAAIALGVKVGAQVASVKHRIEHPLHAYHLVKEELENEKKELFVIIMRDVKGFAIGRELVAMGSLSNTFVHPREVFYPAIRHKAASVILAHNHPSGDPTPSPQDYEVTKTLIEVGKLVGIPVHDHLVIGDRSYVSLRQKGLNFD